MAKCLHDRVRQTCSVCCPAQVFAAYRYKATKQRHLAFTLTLEQFKEIIEKPCVFCGKQSEPRGIDRRDNRIGYIPTNCQSCCGPCNKLKSNLDQHKFLLLVSEIAKHQDALRRQKPERSKESESPAVAINTPGRILDPRVSSEARRFLDGI
jgi:hypothetical protein